MGVRGGVDRPDKLILIKGSFGFQIIGMTITLTLGGQVRERATFKTSRS